MIVVNDDDEIVSTPPSPAGANDREDAMTNSTLASEEDFELSSCFYDLLVKAKQENLQSDSLVVAKDGKERQFASFRIALKGFPSKAYSKFAICFSNERLL